MTIPYDVAGAGPDVLLVHDGLCDRRMWDRQMGSFADSFRVIRCDLPGCGDVPEPRGSFSYAEDVLAVLDGAAHLPGLEQPDEFDRLVLDLLRGAHRA